MKRFSQRHNLSTLAELNVTPLLDLAFVLLIIFMITTPLMEKSSSLVLPSSVAAQNAVAPNKVQMITIDRNSIVKWNDEAMPVGELSSRLAALRQSEGEIAVMIRADKDLPVQKLVDLMDSIKQAGVTKIGVVTRSEAQ